MTIFQCPKLLISFWKFLCLLITIFQLIDLCKFTRPLWN